MGQCRNIRRWKHHPEHVRYVSSYDLIPIHGINVKSSIHGPYKTRAMQKTLTQYMFYFLSTLSNQCHMNIEMPLKWMFDDHDCGLETFSSMQFFSKLSRSLQKFVLAFQIKRHSIMTQLINEIRNSLKTYPRAACFPLWALTEKSVKSLNHLIMMGKSWDIEVPLESFISRNVSDKDTLL